MTHAHVKRLVLVSCLATLGAVGLMVLSIVVPKPLLLVIAMSVGQGLGTLSLASFLLAIALDLQNTGAGGDDQAENEGERLGGEAPRPSAEGHTT